MGEEIRYTAAVITVSDKCSRGEREDTSGPAVKAMLESDGWDVVYRNIVPDEFELIKGELVNNNAVYISHMLEVSGRFVNNGQIYSAYDPLEDAVQCIGGAQIEGSSLIRPYPDN